MSGFTVRTERVRGKARPRVTKHGSYIPKATRDAQKEVLNAFKEQDGIKHTGAVSVWIEVQRHLPESEQKKGIAIQTDTMKPDVDNIVKLILDALNGHAWEDDKSVIECHVIKLPRIKTSDDMDTINVRILDMPTIYRKEI